MLELGLGELNRVLHTNASLNYYFTNKGLINSGSAVNIPAYATSRPLPKIELSKLLLLQLINKKDNSTILVEFFGNQTRAFGVPTKPGFENQYKASGLHALFMPEPGLNLDKKEWELERLFISPTLHELALHNFLPMLLSAPVPNNICTVLTKNNRGQKAYQPDYINLMAKK
jgi:hypothetical protein